MTTVEIGYGIVHPCQNMWINKQSKFEGRLIAHDNHAALGREFVVDIYIYFLPKIPGNSNLLKLMFV